MPCAVCHQPLGYPVRALTPDVLRGLLVELLRAGAITCGRGHVRTSRNTFRTDWQTVACLDCWKPGGRRA